VRGEADPIVAVDIVRCALPLERPVHVGATRYTEREYVALRLRTASGIEGHAIGYTRGLPLDALVEPLARALLGRSVTRRAAIVDELRATRVNAAGALGRAIGLVDIALWDALARGAGLPLSRLLGGARERAPLMAVAGYAALERGVEAVVDEVGALVDAGYAAIKLHTRDVATVEAVRTAAGDRIRVAVDAGMAWRSPVEAALALRPLDDLGLWFLEDPFAPTDVRLYPDLARRLRTPLAAGEDASGPEALIGLAEVVDVLRVDGTASGGFAAALDAAVAGAARGRTVMTHAFPDLHAQLVGHPAIGWVETIADAGVNPVARLLARPQVVDSGALVLSDEPGHGGRLDMGAVEAVARSVIRLTSEEVEG
jgi:L-alanine-DL-glutamate epimerase-like enolase superfamily enzyme